MNHQVTQPSGDTYLFVYDLKSNVLLNAAFPAREGTNTTGQKDANGKLFHHDFIQVAESKGSGWVDYMFPKPGQTQPSQKWAYVKAVKVDGVPSLVASGFYPEWPLEIGQGVLRENVSRSSRSDIALYRVRVGLKSRISNVLLFLFTFPTPFLSPSI